VSSSAGITNGTAGQIGNSISQNSLTSFQVTNSNAGAAAQASYRLYNGNTIADLSVFGTAFTADGVRVANGVALDARPGGAADLALLGTTIRFATSGTTEIARFNTSGLGISRTPTQPLQVKVGTDQVFSLTSASSHLQIQAINDAANAFTQLELAGSIITFAPASTEAARFDTNGDLLLGATAAVDANLERLLVKYTVPKTGASFVCSGTSNNYAIAFRNPNGQVGDISTNGSTTTYNTGSDYRLKENVQPMTGGLATISSLKPVNYDWIIDKTAGEGFIAHELQAVIPAAVTGEKDAVNEDGSIKPQGVDFSKIVPHLVAAIQELTTRLAALESK